MGDQTIQTNDIIGKCPKCGGDVVRTEYRKGAIVCEPPQPECRICGREVSETEVVKWQYILGAKINDEKEHINLFQYLRLMIVIFCVSFTRPFTTTTIDYSTGKILEDK